MPLIVEPTEPNIERAAQILQSGGLVGMPTETVYGLAANALDPQACGSLFAAKRRPRNDPLIVHITNMGMMSFVTDLSCPMLSAVVSALANAFWPGPLTMVLPRTPAVPDIVTAAGPFVGVRMPVHSVALALIRAAGLPLAAPSANRFGHISPISARDVCNEFPDIPDMLVLDGGLCSVGIESTVVRVTIGDGAKPRLEILRRGYVTEKDFCRVLEASGMRSYELTVTKVSVSDPRMDKTAGARRPAQPFDAAAAPVPASVAAPGMFLTHYASAVDTYLLMRRLPDIPNTSAVQLSALQGRGILILDANIDFATYRVREYKELFGAGFTAPTIHITKLYDGAETMLQSLDNVSRHFYAALRESEAMSAIGAVIIIPPRGFFESGHSDAFEASVFDRMFRASSGRVLVAPARLR